MHWVGRPYTPGSAAATTFRSFDLLKDFDGIAFLRRETAEEILPIVQSLRRASVKDRRIAGLTPFGWLAFGLIAVVFRFCLAESCVLLFAHSPARRLFNLEVLK